MALYLLIQVGAYLSRYVPRSWRYFIGVVVGNIVYAIWHSKRRIVRENMATVLGLPIEDPQVRRLAVKAMRNYSKYLVEFLELPVRSSTDTLIASMKIQGLENLHEALGLGKGAIVAGAHFGAIEFGGLRLADFTKFHAVYDRFRPAHLDQLIQRKRLEKGMHLIPANDVREMLRVLHNRGALTMLFDRPTELAKGVRVQFFGRETAVPAGPAVLALKTGVPILPIYVWRNPDKTFEGIVFPPILQAPTGQRAQDIQNITQRLMDTLQIVVRKHPDQWYMFRAMWPATPKTFPARTPEAATGGPAF